MKDSRLWRQPKEVIRSRYKLEQEVIYKGSQWVIKVIDEVRGETFLALEKGSSFLIVAEKEVGS